MNIIAISSETMSTFSQDHGIGCPTYALQWSHVRRFSDVTMRLKSPSNCLFVEQSCSAWRKTQKFCSTLWQNFTGDRWIPSLNASNARSASIPWRHCGVLWIKLHELNVFSLPIFFVMIERIYILCLIIIIKSEVWTITHCLGLGHETMVCAVHPSPKVMADFFRHKNQHDALIQFAQFLVDLWSVCWYSFPRKNVLTFDINPLCTVV